MMKYATDKCRVTDGTMKVWSSGGEFPNREFPRSGIDGNSSGIPFSKMAFSGNSSEFPYRGGILALQGGFFIYRAVLFYLQGGTSSLRH